jgi:hypothetical protein
MAEMALRTFDHEHAQAAVFFVPGTSSGRIRFAGAGERGEAASIEPDNLAHFDFLEGLAML